MRHRQWISRITVCATILLALVGGVSGTRAAVDVCNDKTDTLQNLIGFKINFAEPAGSNLEDFCNITITDFTFPKTIMDTFFEPDGTTFSDRVAFTNQSAGAVMCFVSDPSRGCTTLVPPDIDMTTIESADAPTSVTFSFGSFNVIFTSDCDPGPSNKCPASSTSDSVAITAPEPATLALLAGSLFTIGILRRRMAHGAAV